MFNLMYTTITQATAADLNGERWAAYLVKWQEVIPRAPDEATTLARVLEWFNSVLLKVEPQLNPKVTSFARTSAVRVLMVLQYLFPATLTLPPVRVCTEMPDHMVWSIVEAALRCCQVDDGSLVILSDIEHPAIGFALVARLYLIAKCLHPIDDPTTKVVPFASEPAAADATKSAPTLNPAATATPTLLTATSDGNPTDAAPASVLLSPPVSPTVETVTAHAQRLHEVCQSSLYFPPARAFVARTGASMQLMNRVDLMRIVSVAGGVVFEETQSNHLGLVVRTGKMPYVFHQQL